MPDFTYKPPLWTPPGYNSGLGNGPVVQRDNYPTAQNIPNLTREPTAFEIDRGLVKRPKIKTANDFVLKMQKSPW